MYPRLETKWANPVNENVLRTVFREPQESLVTINDQNDIGESLISANVVLENMIVVAANEADYSLISITLPVLDWAANWIKFHELVNEWKKRKRISSRAQDIISDPNYMQIIGMGAPAVPLILFQLRGELQHGEPDHWFAALWAITGENPVPLASRGNLVKMAEAWLDWGAARGIVSAKGVGIVFPESW